MVIINISIYIMYTLHYCVHFLNNILHLIKYSHTIDIHSNVFYITHIFIYSTF